VNLPLLLTILLGGIAALDATPVAQTLLSQPLVTGTLLAALWGDWRTGSKWRSSFRCSRPARSRSARVRPLISRPVVSLESEPRWRSGRAARSRSLRRRRHGGRDDRVDRGGAGHGAAPLAAAAQRGLARWCEAEVRRGNDRALGQAHTAAVVLAFAVGVGYSAAASVLASAGLQGLAVNESLRLARAWRLAEPLWLGLGLAQLLHLFVQRRLLRVALFGSSLVAAWLWLLVGSH
jgi:hypothetical protein